MRLGILGPLLVVDDAGTEIPMPAARQRALLVALLVRANQIVSADELVEIVWDGEPPDGAALTLRSYVMRLRRAAGPAVAARIVTRHPGYLCQVSEDEFDVLRFEGLCRQGGAALRSRDWQQAADTLTEALGLWRGTALEDVSSQVLHRDWAQRLEQVRLLALDQRIEADLHLGRHDQLVPELRTLVGGHPLREHGHAQLMLALHRCGQRAAALEAYRDARRILVDQLGVEPGAELRELHERILTGTVEPAPAGPRQESGATAVPRQLPTTVRHFTGRAEQLKALSDLLPQAGQAGGAVVISAIDGTAGIGKTALAVHWAHQHADRFPDGQLFVNLRGFDPAGDPVPVAVAVRRFLDALGVPPARIPADLDAAIDLYRSHLADKRVLVVLDNARDAEQVRPLLPGAAGCLALITSRNRLSGLVALEGAVPLTLDLLTRHEARDLLSRRLGAERTAREERAVEELISLCARLPLALNIAAARSALRPDPPVAALVDELRDARRRLDALSGGERAADLRAVFSWSYQTIDPRAARLFRLLGSHSGPDISVPAAASLAAVPLDDARQALDELARAHLLTEHAPGRYGFHDLLRAYAGEQARSHDTDAARREAVHRVLDHYLHTASNADRWVDPGRDPLELAPTRPGTTPEVPTDLGQAMQWYQAEHAVLLAAIAQAAAEGFDTHAWQLAWAAADFFQRQGHWHDQIDSHRTALEAARRLGHRAGQAYAHRVLGRAHTRLGSYQDAHTHLSRALELYDQSGDRLGQAHTHRALAWVLERQDDTGRALDHADRAVALFQAADHKPGQTTALNAVGWLRARRGDYQQALAACRQAVDMARELGDDAGQANALESIGYAYHHLGRYAQAIASYRQALPILREVGELYFEADTLTHLGDTHLAAGDPAAAHRAWREALVIFDDLQHPDAEAVRVKLALRS